ncbi:MAG TPA: hypothetical protein DCZ30_06945 [Clostridiales bacterium]|nr:hypothetical protein [Clostridiales bacterium]
MGNVIIENINIKESKRCVGENMKMAKTLAVVHTHTHTHTGNFTEKINIMTCKKIIGMLLLNMGKLYKKIVNKNRVEILRIKNLKCLLCFC